MKIALRPDAPTAKVESDDLLSVKGGRAERDSTRQAAERAGLGTENE